MYKVTVNRGRKIVERNCFSNIKDSERHFAFLEKRYFIEKEDFNVKITIKHGSEIIKAA
jgi:hypothetical protein